MAEESDFQQANTSRGALASTKQLPPSACHLSTCDRLKDGPRDAHDLISRAVNACDPSFPDRIKLRIERWNTVTDHPEGTMGARGCLELRWRESWGWSHAERSEQWTLQPEKEAWIKEERLKRQGKESLDLTETSEAAIAHFLRAAIRNSQQPLLMALSSKHTDSGFLLATTGADGPCARLHTLSPLAG